MTKDGQLSERIGKIGLKDVALEAGVSVSTASKALNGRPDVSQRTRDRVLGVAERLMFSPNQLARSLPTGRSFSVGLLTSDAFGRFSIPLLMGAEDALSFADLAVIFCDTRDDPEREQRQLRSLMSRHVDGIIVNGRRTEPRQPLTHVAGLPVVYALAPSLDRRDCSVVSAEASGAVLAIDHLLGQGRRRIAHLTGPLRHRSAVVRAQAMAGHLEAHGLAVHGQARFGAWSEEWGRHAVLALLDEAPDVDSIFCGSDQVARGAIDELRAAGRHIPGDVAVVGFDNWEPMAIGSRPQLTTIDMNMDVIGRVAAQHLLAAVDGHETPTVTSIACRLVVRGSA